MIVNERAAAYIRSLETAERAVLEQIEREALEQRIPIIRKETQVLLCMKKPKKILEIGTAVGFSALLMSEYVPEDCRIITIENYAKRIPVAKANFERMGKERQIALIEGDALDVLKGLDAGFDFIFMDAAKGQYIYYLPEVLRILEEDGILLSDNVLQGGDVLESRFAVERTIHARMREYLYELKHHDSLMTSILPLGDGVAVSVKRSDIAGRA